MGRLKREFPYHLMILPGVLFVLLYSYVPMAGLVIAFQNFVPVLGFSKSSWAGFDNFVYIYHLPSVGQVLWNTLFIAVMKIAAGLLVPIAVALLLNELRLVAFKRTVQTLIYLPHFLSWVILAGILSDVLSLDGIVNRLVTAFGGEPIYFLGDSRIFPFTLVASDVWKEFGFATIVYLAALTGIDPSLYEAARIDGANRWRQTLYVTLPGIVPIIILMATLSLGNVLNAGFDQVFNLYNPSVYSTGDIIDTMIYRVGLQQSQFSVSTALGLFKSFVSFALISISYILAYRFANYRIF
ncbi:ABC transporter permease [Cohnella fermenti]|uniref:Sugar ABC transporter permease n=1 Tax=Cohnella fermenti TaxID=2565925 RepID=A0A4S4BLW6_9BACL|nr:ABC transporter permease subunit [Cohnella fermenti]THF74835.1 sugar ABC transporter permease [Cohnella fermenti]